MSDIELRELIASLAIDRKREATERRQEAAERRQEAAERRQEAAERNEEAAERRKEDAAERERAAAERERAAAEREKEAANREKFNRQMDERHEKFMLDIEEIKAIQKEIVVHQKETDRLIKENARRQGATDHNNGDIAEEFFFQAFDKTKRIDNIEFSYVHPHFNVPAGKHSALEIDILLLNGKWCAVVEVKYKCHPNDVTRFYKKQDKILTILARQSFHPYYPEKYMFVLASNLFVPGCEKRSYEYGIALVRPDGQELAIDTSHLKGYNIARIKGYDGQNRVLP